MIKISDFDLRLLRVFKAVTDCGGFSAAESALNMNLSTISLHMTDLETRLGVRLCERGRRGFRLTEEGTRLYVSAEKLLASVEHFRADVGEMLGQVSGKLAIGAVDNTVTNPLSQLSAAIEAIKRRGGDLTITLDIRSPGEIEEAVLEGRLDVGIGPFRTLSANLHYEPLYSEDLYLYCARGHAAFDAAPADIDVASINTLDHVARGHMREAKELPNTENFKVRAVAYSMEAVAILVLSGKLVGFIPDHYAARWVAEGMMRPLRPDVFKQRTQFSLVTRRDRERTSALDLFAKTMHEGARMHA